MWSWTEGARCGSSYFEFLGAQIRHDRFGTVFLWRLQLAGSLMKTLDSLSFGEFNEILLSADSRGRQRLIEINNLLSNNCVFLFGYGAKGRSLAWQIRNGSDTKVFVYDSNP